jgi:hypothetical protein
MSLNRAIARLELPAGDCFQYAVMETLTGGKMLRRSFLQVLAGGVLAGMVPAVYAGDSKAPRESVAEKLGERMNGILNGATKAEAFRIAHKPSEKPEGKHVSGYPVLSAAKEQGKDFAKRLSALVQDEKSLFSAQARCFSPGVAFRLWKEKESVDVVVCYKCWGLRLTARDADGEVLHEAGGGFKANYDAWVKLAKEAFPEDKQIQALGEGGRL